MKKLYSLLSALALTVPLSSVALCQEAGEATDGAQESGTLSAVISIVAQDENDDEANDHDEKSPVQGTATVTGKIVVIGPDGKTHTYDLNDPLPEEFQAIIQQHQGRAAGAGLRIGPAELLELHDVQLNSDDAQEGEGNKLKLERIITRALDGNDGVYEFRLSAEADEAKEQYMIGVHCDAAGDVLRRQLKLGETGLVVNEVVDDMPASDVLAAGDILLRVNDTDLTSLESLVDVVRGSEGHELKITLLRDGDRMEVTLTPQKKQVATQFVIGMSEDGEQPAHDVIVWRSDDGTEKTADEVRRSARRGTVNLRQLLPGMVVDKDSSPERIHALLLDAHRKAFESATAADGDEAESGHHDAHSVDDVRRQIQQIRRQLKSLEDSLRQIEHDHDEEDESRADEDAPASEN